MDVNQKAYDVLLQSIGEKPAKKPNPRAAKRGEARAKAMSPGRRQQIAKKAASVRWGRREGDGSNL